MKMDLNETLRKELQDPEFARYYGEDQAKTELALAIYAVRSKLKLTQSDLANKLNISQPYIAKLEKGDINPTVGHIGSLLALVGFKLKFYTEALISDRVEAVQPMVTKTTSSIDTTVGYPGLEENSKNTSDINSFNAVG